MNNIAVAEIEVRGESNGRLVSGGNGDQVFYVHGPVGSRPSPRAESRPSDLTLLNIMNRILHTNCKDAEAIDATAAWDVIVEELAPYTDLAPILALCCQAGITQKELGRILGLPLHEVQLRFQKAMGKLRHPCRIQRIRNSIMGWQNLYRDV